MSALGLTDNKLTQGSYYITMDAGTVTDIAVNDAAAITKDANHNGYLRTESTFTTNRLIVPMITTLIIVKKTQPHPSGTVAEQVPYLLLRLSFLKVVIQ
ncbi:MAG: hypothetical protein H0A76_02065 [Candidatus Thiodubiliella endoseptemdiera]|uniref:Uncharacterized protein n=1 Tax=Candidatus Thiodubiliella endoseptemdiera TaxID=2738886 RepID=A0A853F4R9_9GAMM|nr:hypothetical protein [Candidatus Thiodubiliella endoseptemdiera]